MKWRLVQLVFVGMFLTASASGQFSSGTWQAAGKEGTVLQFEFVVDSNSGCRFTFGTVVRQGKWANELYDRAPSLGEIPMVVSVFGGTIEQWTAFRIDHEESPPKQECKRLSPTSFEARYCYNVPPPVATGSRYVRETIVSLDFDFPDPYMTVVTSFWPTTLPQENTRFSLTPLTAAPIPGSITFGVPISQLLDLGNPSQGDGGLGTLSVASGAAITLLGLSLLFGAFGGGPFPGLGDFSGAGGQPTIRAMTPAEEDIFDRIPSNLTLDKQLLYSDLLNYLEPPDAVDNYQTMVGMVNDALSNAQNLMSGTGAPSVPDSISVLERNYNVGVAEAMLKDLQAQANPPSATSSIGDPGISSQSLVPSVPPDGGAGGFTGPSGGLGPPTPADASTGTTAAEGDFAGIDNSDFSGGDGETD